MKHKRWLCILPTALLLACSGDRMSSWHPALEDDTIYALNKNLAEARNHIESALQYQKTDRKFRAEEELILARKNIDQLETYFFPLINGRAHIAAAFRLSRRNEIFKSKEEMTKARAQLTRASANTEEENAKIIEQISSEILILQESLIKANYQTDEQFNRIAVKITKLINSQTQPII